MGIDAEMFVRTKAPVAGGDVKRWRYEMASAFGADRFWIFKDANYRRHCMERIEVYEQDGDDIRPEPGETFLRVYPKTRYYGEGYERGDLPLLVTLAAWLEQKIPGGTVWYGGDSSGVCAEPFDEAARGKLFAHFVAVDHRPYASGWESLSDDPSAVMCGFCKVRMHQIGFGGTGYGRFHCRGCGDEIETRDGRQTFQKARAL